jgi:hypothetical protein
MPPDDILRTLRARIPDAAVAQSVSMDELRVRRADISPVLLDPDAPMPPISLTARETYFHAESGIGVLKLYNSSRVDPLALQDSGLVYFGSSEWVDLSADNLPGYYRTVQAPHDDAAVSVLFLPSVLQRVYVCRLFAKVHEDRPCTLVVRSSSGAEQNFVMADSARLRPFIISVEIREAAWHDLHFSLNEPFAWTFERAEVSKTTTPC